MWLIDVLLVVECCGIQIEIHKLPREQAFTKYTKKNTAMIPATKINAREELIVESGL